MDPILIFMLGFACGAGLLYIYHLLQRKNAQEIANELFTTNMQAMSHAFSSLSRDALTQSNNDLLRMADQQFRLQSQMHQGELDQKKGLIDQQLEHMRLQLGDVSRMVQELERDRENKFGALTQELQNVNQQVQRLGETTGQLQQALADNRARGQWGERIAEDILKLLGFQEHINYVRQAQTSSRTRPDFTFILPQGRKLHMDVKFPLDNYMSYLQAGSRMDRDVHLKMFLRDVKHRIREVSSKDYINPADDTVDCVLMFVPNEQIYRFIHENDHHMIEMALGQRVIICSPVTLFGVLAVVRQAVENFIIQQSSRQIIDLLTEFEKQWARYNEQMGKMGDALEKAQDAYEALTTTRTRQLERPLRQIDKIRHQFDSEEREALAKSNSR